MKIEDFDSNPLSTDYSIQIPNLTTATIQAQIPQLQSTWDIGVQQATLDRVPYSRTYSVLSFPFTDYEIDRIELGAYSSEYEASFYYRVASNFLEDVYISQVEESEESESSFLRWRHYRTTFRQELTYLHKPISTLTWNRPLLGDGITYQPLTSPFVLPIVRCGQAIAASIQTVGDYKAELISPTDSEKIDVTNQSIFLLTKPQLQITLLNLSVSSHVQVTVTFYGQYRWRSFFPISEEELPTLIHPVNQTLSNRMKPPGLSHLPDNFWNSNPSLSLEEFNQRLGISPAWI